MHSQEFIDFIKANAANYSDNELREMIKIKFDCSMSRDALKALRWKHKIKGRDKYKPYQELTERVNSRGYTLVKINKKWLFKQRVIYEKAHGKIPPGQEVVFLDGDNQNFALENLAVMPRADKLSLASSGLIFADPESTKTGIAIVQVRQAIKRRRKAAVKLPNNSGGIYAG